MVSEPTKLHEKPAMSHDNTLWSRNGSLACTNYRWTREQPLIPLHHLRTLPRELVIIPSPRVVVSSLHRPSYCGIVILRIGWVVPRSSFPHHPPTALPPSRRTAHRCTATLASGSSLANSAGTHTGRLGWMHAAMHPNDCQALIGLAILAAIYEVHKVKLRRCEDATY
jgi:hypothetical protein